MNKENKKHPGYILIIDDDPDIRLLMKKLLVRGGYAVDTASGKEQAWEKLSIKLPSLILLDVLLSGSDGRELCKTLKSSENTREVPVIIFSAHPGVAGNIEKYGADDFLSKPINSVLLLQKVDHLLSAKAN